MAVFSPPFRELVFCANGELGTWPQRGSCSKPPSWNSCKHLCPEGGHDCHGSNPTTWWWTLAARAEERDLPSLVWVMRSVWRKMHWQTKVYSCGTCRSEIYLFYWCHRLWTSVNSEYDVVKANTNLICRHFLNVEGELWCAPKLDRRVRHTRKKLWNIWGH